MKCLKLLACGAALMLAAAPVAAQFGSDSLQFLEAAKKGDNSTGARLLENHPSIIDVKDSKGDTALIIAISRENSDLTAYLLNKGANPNLGGAGGETPLIAAVRVGFDDAADWLLSMGAKVDGTNRMGETPLIVAVQRRNPALVRRLLEAGANPDRTDSAAGYSARDYANRDPRARDIQKLIEVARPKPAHTAK